MKRSDYHAHPALGSSAMKNLATSYALWKCEAENPFERSTSAMDFGTAVHTAILEPQFLETQVEILETDVSLATKEGKALAADARARKGEDVIILKPRDGWILRNAVASVKSLFAPYGWNPFEEAGESEVPFMWHEPRLSGRAPFEKPGALSGKGLLDRLVGTLENPEWIIDVKVTAGSLDPRELSRYAHDYGLHIQASWYLRGIEEHSGKRPAFAFLFVSRAPPFSVALYTCSPDLLRAGELALQRAFTNWELAEPDPASGLFQLDLPAWSVQQLESNSIPTEVS